MYRNIKRKLRNQLKQSLRSRYPYFWVIALLGLIVPWLNVEDIGPLLYPTVTCQVRRIYDGDTMTLNCNGRKVKARLYCIDAPEMNQHPWGRKSRDALRMMTPRTVKLRKISQDKYGRIVGEVFMSGAAESLNLQMVRQGQAAVYQKYCNSFGYSKAEQNAQNSKKGIWRQAGLHQKPWISRN